MNALVLSDKKQICPPPADYLDDTLEDEATGFSSDDDYYEGPPNSQSKKWENCKLHAHVI